MAGATDYARELLRRQFLGAWASHRSISLVDALPSEPRLAL